MSASLIEALSHPEVYPHPIEKIEVIETHISWIVLTGTFAYKIKKPVNLGFLDFSSLDQRKHFCHREVKLNQRTAPDLYVSVVGLCKTDDLLSWVEPDDDSVEACEYAIKMVQFCEDHLLSHLHQDHLLNFSHIDDMAHAIAHFHEIARTAEEASSFGSPDQVLGPMMQNFEQLRDLVDSSELIRQLEHIENWTLETHSAFRDTLQERKAAGFIRECHGDLHLNNMTLLDHKVTLFDGIEFNDAFRWIDVISDIAFLVMDLEARGENHFANRLTNTYLEHTGDYAGVRLLPFYKVYRAIVRAKVALFTLQNTDADADRQAALINECQLYVDLADQYTGLANRIVLTMHGVSGTGKSTVAQRLVDRMPKTIRIRSDVERKRLHGLKAQAVSCEQTTTDIYSTEATQATYERIEELSGLVLDSGYSVIIDATNLNAWQRTLLLEVAERRGVPECIINCRAPIETIRSWIEKRTREAEDASEANIDVVEKQMLQQEPLSEDEQVRTIHVFSANVDFTQELVREINEHLG